MNEFLIELQAKLDEAKSKGLINSDIDKIQGQLNKLKVQAEIDPGTISNLVKQLEGVINQKITISNINIDQSQAIKNAQKTGQQMGEQINHGITQGLRNNSNILNTFRRSLQNIGMGPEEIDAVANRINNLGVQIESLNQSTSHAVGKRKDRNILSVDISGIDKLGQAIKLTEQYNMATGDLIKSIDSVSTVQQKAGSTTNTFAKQQSQAVANLTNQINQLNRAANDQNASRPITDSTHLSNISNSYNEIISAIQRMGNASKDTFITEQNNVKTLISNYKSLVSEFRNAENVSTKMKGTDLASGLAIARNDLEKFKSDAKDFPQIVQTINNLDKAITNVGDASSLNAFNDQLRVARSELAKIKSEASFINRNEKVGINVSGLQSQITDLQRISPEISKFEAEINGAKVTVQSLLNDLSKVNTQGDFSVVNAKWKAFTDTAKAAGIAVTDVGNKTSQSTKESLQLLSSLEKSYQNIKNLQVKKRTLDPVVDSSKISKLNDEITKAKNNYNNAFRAANGNFDISTWKEIKSAIDSATKSKIEYNNAEKADYLNGQKNNLSVILTNLKSSLQESGLYTDELKQKLTILESELINISNKGDLSTFKANLKLVESEIETVSKINKIQFQIETGGYDSKVETLISKTRQWTDEAGNAKISTTDLSRALENLKTASDTLSKSNTVENQKALVAAEKELDTQIKIVTNSVKSMNAELAKDSTVSSLHQQIQEFYDKNGATHRKWGTQLKQMLAETSSGASLTNARVREIEASFIGVGNAARQAGKLGKSWFQTIREGMSSFSYWTSSTFLVMKALQSIKGGVGTVRSLDTALVDLKKTTTMTVSELENFYYDSNKVAKQMGATTKEIIDQASAWSRLGFSSNEAATKMSKYSSMFASISPGMNIDTATDGLVSVMKAFDIGNDSPDDVLDGIMSKINIIGNTAATSNAEIVNMLTRSSSAMKEANNTLEETIALETAAVEITRDDNSVGNAFKTKNCLYVQKCA